MELLLTPGEDVEIVRVLESPPTSVAAGGLRVALSDLVVGDELHAVAKLVEAPTFGLGELGAVIGLAVIAAGLPGFMGSETTAAGSFVAPVMLVAFGLQAGLERLGALVPGSVSDVLGMAQLASSAGDGGSPSAPSASASRPGGTWWAPRSAGRGASGMGS